MFEKTYQRKPHTTKAVQYDGTEECALDLAGEYLKLLIQGNTLYYMDGDNYEEVYEGDWVTIEGMSATGVIDRDVFGDNYQEVR